MEKGKDAIMAAMATVGCETNTKGGGFQNE